MKILVVEDSEKHQSSAREALVGHEIEIVGTFEEAKKLFQKGETFDVLLSDMMLPVVRYNQSTYDQDEEVYSFLSLSDRAFEQYGGQEMPLGFTLALLAASKGVKFIAVVTDSNHHDDPISASLDSIAPAYWEDNFSPNFMINGARAMFVHTPFLKDIVYGVTCGWCEENPGVCHVCDGTGFNKHANKPCHACKDDLGKCRPCKGTTKIDKEIYERKDWGTVLASLIT